MHRLIKTTRRLTALLFATVLASAPGLAAGSLPANTCIVSGALDRTPTGSSEVAMVGGLDSFWRMLACCTIEKFRPGKPCGLVITFR